MQPLSLDLRPLPALRAPLPGGITVRHGFLMHLSDGTVVHHTDPLLRAFAAHSVALPEHDADEEALQDERFDPGRTLRLLAEGLDSDGDPLVGVYEADGLRRIGLLPFNLAVVVAAGLERGMAFQGTVLEEKRTYLDDRRESILVLLHEPSLVTATPAPGAGYARPARSARRRIVLFVDGDGEPRWWDPSAALGPSEITDLPVSPELSAELDRLKDAYARLSNADEAEGYFDEMEQGWTRESLEQRTRVLWCRARAELGRTHAIGLLGPGMKRPAWSPDETAAPESADDDIPF